MAVKKYQILQKQTNDNLIMHPETDASIVVLDNSSGHYQGQSTNVQNALEEVYDMALQAGGSSGGGCFVNGVATDVYFTSDPQAQIGNLSSLATTEKNSLVGAINEVKNSGGNTTKLVFNGKKQFLSYVNWSDYGVTAQDFTNYDYLEITWGNKTEIKNAYLLSTATITSSIKNFYPMYCNNDKTYTNCCLYISTSQFGHNNTYYYYCASSGSNNGVYIYKIRFVKF